MPMPDQGCDVAGLDAEQGSLTAAQIAALLQQHALFASPAKLRPATADVMAASGGDGLPWREQRIAARRARCSFCFFRSSSRSFGTPRHIVN